MTNIKSYANKLILIVVVYCSTIFAVDYIPLSQKYMNNIDRDAEYTRGNYLIVLAHSDLNDYLTNPNDVPIYGGDFVEFKRTQGFDVDVISMDEEGISTADELKTHIENYYNQHPLLEYVLLVGDVNGTLIIPTFFINSINEDEEDVTDYPYTFFDNPLQPNFFLGRWSIRSSGDLLNIKTRSMQYYLMEEVSENADYLNSALLVAGNYSTNDGTEIPPSSWPVTPVWTSYWLMDRLYGYGYTDIDTAFFHADYQVEENPLVVNSWTDGVGVINYRGWGNSHGWHKPAFYIEDINDLNHGWNLPIVMSFVCNTGDFGADVPPQSGPAKCFGEELLTRGTPFSPKGAAAMVGPSDLDTDTKYNNVICAVMWDNLLEENVSELAPALFSGKQSLIAEFPENPDGVVEFYHHVYGILGDPSISVRLHEPSEIDVDYVSDNLNQSYIFVEVYEETESNPIVNAVGALMYNGELIGKALTNWNGDLYIDFDGVPNGSTLDLYINSPQYYQKHIVFNYIEDGGTPYDPDVFLAFDITPILSNGETYISPNEDIDFSLEIFNYYSETQQITVYIEDFQEVMENDNSTPETIEIPALSSSETGVLFSGNLGNYAIGSRIIFGVGFEIDGIQVGGNYIEIMIGPVAETDPVPADNYGYWAYDNLDLSYEESPVYDWVELNPDDGGLGTNLNLVDDTVTEIEIGFTFKYYGVEYTTATVSSNGWLSFEPCQIPYFWNFSIPMPLGPSALVAPFMDDLDDNVGTEPFNVFLFSDNERLIIQWDNVSNGEDDENCPDCVKETFQLILNNPSTYPTPTGDGEIIFQYQEIHDIDLNGNYSTIGIESPDQNSGLQYLFNNQLSLGASPIVEGTAIKITTTPPANSLKNQEEISIKDYLLLSSYPNPFNPVTNITYFLPTSGATTVNVYNLLGKKLITLFNGYQSAGNYNITWDASSYSTGLYFVQVVHGNRSSYVKVVLLK